MKPGNFSIQYISVSGLGLTVKKLFRSVDLQESIQSFNYFITKEHLCNICCNSVEQDTKTKVHFPYCTSVRPQFLIHVTVLYNLFKLRLHNSFYK